MAPIFRFDIVTRLLYVDDESKTPDTNERLLDTFYDGNANYCFVRRRVEIGIEFPRHYFTYVPPENIFGLNIAARLKQRLVSIPGIAHIDATLLSNSNVLLDVTRYGLYEWHNEVLKPLKLMVEEFCDPNTWAASA